MEDSKIINRIYILPIFNQCGYKLKEENIIYQGIGQIQNFHYNLTRIVKKQSKLIPKYTYKEVDVDTSTLLEQNNRFYFPDYIEDAHNEGVIHVGEELKNKVEGLFNKACLSTINKSKDHIEIEYGGKTKFREVINRIKEKNTFSSKGTMLVIEGENNLVSMRECIVKLVRTDKWLVDCVLFFKSMTKQGICFDIDYYDLNKRIEERQYSSCDYFLFNELGEVEKFIALGTIYFYSRWYEEREQKFILDNNIRAFRKWIESVHYLLSSGGELYKYDVKHHEHPISILNASPLAYSTFDEVVQIIRNRTYLKEKHKKIGVFMDGANILYNLEPLTIDYNKLLQMLYGEDALNSIIVKKCVVFRSTLENKNMQEKQDLYIKKVKTNLEDVGFEVEIVSNYSQKANQIDDNKLIDIIRSYKNKLDRVLIMTGDQHFIPVIEEYRDEGKEVYVTSLEQQNTSSKIVNTAGITHYYINEIQDIIQL